MSSYTETLEATKKFEQKLKDAFYHSKLFGRFRMTSYEMKDGELTAYITEIFPCRCAYECNNDYYTFKFPMSAIEKAFEKEGFIDMEPLRPYLIKKNEDGEDVD